MYGTLSVYLRDNHNINPSGYGFLMTTSAITVVLFQFWVSRIIKYRPPFLMMALGTVFYMIGFALFGIVTAYFLFALNIVIITIGEMIVVPVSQSIASNFAPETMRGRYMAIFGLSWAIPSTSVPARQVISWITTTRTCSGISAARCVHCLLLPTTSSIYAWARSQNLLPTKEDAFPVPATTD